MKLRVVVMAVLAMFGWFAIALAGPIEGELFGYRLGSRYPATDDTKGYHSILGSTVILAEKPEKPADFQRVELITTPKTFTIINIYGIAEFLDEKQAKALAAQYADILDTAHGNKCPSTKAYLGESLKLVCEGQYVLTVAYYAPDKTDKKHKVHVGLTFDNMSRMGKLFTAQFDQEWKQLEAEGKTHRLEQAEKEQKLQGLQ